jgi:hypothetical protein
VIGLDHPPSDEPGAFEATMFASASAGDTGKRTLADDDIEGTCTIYPSDDDVAGECYGVGRPAPLTLRFEQTACGASGQGAMGVLALVLILRRRRTSAYTVSAG